MSSLLGGRRLFSSARRTSCLPSDSQAAHNLLHRFFHVLDGHSELLLSGLFAAQGTLHIQKADLVLSGKEIDEWCVMMQQRWAAGGPTLHVRVQTHTQTRTLPTLLAVGDRRVQTWKQVESNIVLEAPEPQARCIMVSSYWTALQRGVTTSYGIHADVLEADAAGEWTFRSRVITHTYSA